MKNNKNITNLIRALVPTFVAIAYILLGYFFKSGWRIGWILFLLIPIVETLMKAIQTKNPSHFCYPVLVAAIYLSLGMIRGLWHPSWVIFVTIPAFYAVCDYFKKSNNDNCNNKNSQEEIKDEIKDNVKSGKVAIKITAIICVTAIIIISIINIFGDNRINIHIPSLITMDNIVTEESGDFEFSPKEIEFIVIKWTSGEVNIRYDNTSKIIATESSKDEITHKMGYVFKNDTLTIEEFIGSINNGERKNLTITLPDGFDCENIEIEVVSADINADNINCDNFKVESVSGNVDANFIRQPYSVDIETVSGDNVITLPKSISGYSVDMETVSGNFDAKVFNQQKEFGDAETNIYFESISGNLKLKKA